ncbi:hypothetical protein J4558_01955 [Leptolyngbya sp. 15MV]|nr:hypothetical protein J4558_01955 [Leptolyngbya sp. 15MV]
MMSLRAVLGITLAAGLLALGGCELFYPSETLRYRMTVIVDTPQGQRSGSSVLESTITAGTQFGDASGIRFSLRGEAVAVPLPNGKVLFALLGSDTGGDPAIYHSNLVQNAACGEGRPSLQPDPALCGGAQWKVFRPWARERSLAAELGPSLYPMLVTFDDMDDPASVALVDSNDLATSFGSGVRLRSITLQLTDDAVTMMIEEQLNWLESFGREHGVLKPSGSIYLEDAEPINRVAPGHFSTELYK